MLQMRILLSNHDGIHAPGIALPAQVLHKFASVRADAGKDSNFAVVDRSCVSVSGQQGDLSAHNTSQTTSNGLIRAGELLPC